jgi:hypothetical protein
VKLNRGLILTLVSSGLAFALGFGLNAPEKIAPASLIADFHNTCIPSVRDKGQNSEARFEANGFKRIPNWTTAHLEQRSSGYSKMFRDSGFVVLVSEPTSATDMAVKKCTVYASSGDVGSIRRSMLTTAGDLSVDTVLDGNRKTTWAVDATTTQFSIQFVEYADGADSRYSLAALPYIAPIN